MDALSDLLRSVRLTGGVYLDVPLTAPWSVMSGVVADDCRPLLHSPAQLIAYHLLTEGRMLISAANEQTVEVVAGEIVLLPRKDPHVISSGQGLELVMGSNFVVVSPDGGLARVRAGGGGTPTNMVSFFLGTDDGYSPLVASLPRVLTLDVKALASRGLIDASLAYAVSELVRGRVASSDVMSRVSELLFVEAVRLYAERSDATTGWLRDPRIGKALALLHANLEAPWSADRLARDVALSRSAFMKRFTHLVGQPPMQYLAAYRQQMAQELLTATSFTVAQIAARVGYDSERSFSRAFKRAAGMTPSHWRARRRA
jgi:AraC-like DNA-binding protein